MAEFILIYLKDLSILYSITSYNIIFYYILLYLIYMYYIFFKESLLH
jgi:hypothetical protein